MLLRRRTETDACQAPRTNQINLLDFGEYSMRFKSFAAAAVTTVVAWNSALAVPASPSVPDASEAVALPQCAKFLSHAVPIVGVCARADALA
jgi:hypothetical protein